MVSNVWTDINQGQLLLRCYSCFECSATLALQWPQRQQQIAHSAARSQLRPSHLVKRSVVFSRRDSGTVFTEDPHHILVALHASHVQQGDAL